MMKDSLNSEQTKIFEYIVNKVNQNDWKDCVIEKSSKYSEFTNNKVMVLQGFAGVGKTFLLQAIDEELKQKCAYLAPTNKAKKVLQEKIIFNNVTTIHKALGLVPDKEKKLKSTGNFQVDWNTSQVVFIDESSMLSPELYSHLFGTLNILFEKNIKDRPFIVFVGDPAQILPVETDNSSNNKTEQEIITKVFRDDFPLKCLKLETIVRQAEGNPIIDLASKIRKTGFKITDCNYPTNIRVIKASDIKAQSWVKIIEQIKFNNSIYAAYTNSAVENVNRFIQKLLYPESNGWFEQGQKVIAGEAIKNAATGQIVFDNGDELEIETIFKDRLYERFGASKNILGYTTSWQEFDDNEQIIDNPGYEVAQMRLRNPDTGEVAICGVCTQKGLLQREKFLNRLAKFKMWKNFYAEKEMTADIRLPYAMTCHKLQGSTYNNVYIDLEDILTKSKSFETNKLLYVAVTRARHNVVLIQKQ